jgi:hypothetical protein
MTPCQELWQPSWIFVCWYPERSITAHAAAVIKGIASGMDQSRPDCVTATTASPSAFKHAADYKPSEINA